VEKAPEAFRTISEVADELKVPKHVLRFWEGKFTQIRPMKRGGGRRYYRPEDVEFLKGIRRLLYEEGYTIKGVQKVIRESGVEYVKSSWQKPSTGARPRPPAGAQSPGPSAAGVREGTRGELGEATRRPLALARGQIRQLRHAMRELEECLSLLKAA
jgi:DNA-binding transcriptional MerR regulator